MKILLTSAAMLLLLNHATAFRSISHVKRTIHQSTVTHLSAKKGNTASSTFAPSGSFWTANTECWRPTVNDVERISWGKPAKKKGTGSRGVPHRLNAEERLLFDQARRKGFLEVAGSGWRSQRREAPLLNSFRSLCDARAQASIVLHKSNTGMNDELVVDLSPLRIPESFPQIAQVCLEQHEGGEIFFQESVLMLSNDEEGETSDDQIVDEGEVVEAQEMWESRPVYQLPPYCIAWEISRPEAKALGKKMAELFNTADGKIAASKKPVGVKAGKSRRHGGYGIG